MHKIEQQVYEYIEQVGLGKVELTDSIIEEFGERCKDALKKHVSELREREFTLRMSNIGRPLRNLMLDKEHGYKPVSADFILKMLYGSLYEALTIVLLKGAGVGVSSLDGQVSLEIANTVVNGMYDVVIDDKVYDIKTASPYSFDKKFVSWETLAFSDDFGYLGQGFGYAKAAELKFGGWIVINKVTGQLKVVEIPDDIHDGLMEKHLKEVAYKINHINKNFPMPACTGTVEETYYKKPTGNVVLGGSCRFCSHKEKCHPTIQYMPSKAGKSESPKYVHYISIKEENE